MTAGRWELLRALGAVADNPADAVSASEALALPRPDRAGHTEVFVLNCPPYASVYLGAEGGLGGEGTDRVAGFWRAIGLSPPAEPDHLAALLGLYAGLGEAAQDSRRPATVGALTRARHVLLAEHLWPWLPGYLDAVTGLGIPALAGWARLAGQALLAEYRPRPGSQLSLAQRAAPPPVAAGGPLTDLLDTLTVPVRSGFILTRRRLAVGARDVGAGYRLGERRFALRTLIEQAPAATFSWLAAEAARWSRRHARWAAGDPAQQWWARRSAHTGQVLHMAATAAADQGAVAGAASPTGGQCDHQCGQRHAGNDHGDQLQVAGAGMPGGRVPGQAAKLPDQQAQCQDRDARQRMILEQGTAHRGERDRGPGPGEFGARGRQPGIGVLDVIGAVRQTHE